MPSVSERQRQAACMALAAKKGEISSRKLKGPAATMYRQMSETQLEHFCKYIKKK